MTNTNKKAIEILKKNRPSWGTRECDRELCWAVDTAIDVLNAFENLGDFVTKFADSYDYALVAKDVWRDAKKALEEKDELYDFANWVAEEIFDENWEYNKDAFAELACRKLIKLGIVRANGDEWELVEPQKSEDEE